MTLVLECRALIEIQEQENDEVICEVAATHIVNDPGEDSLVSQLRWEKFKRDTFLKQEPPNDDDQSKNDD